MKWSERLIYDGFRNQIMLFLTFSDVKVKKKLIQQNIFPHHSIEFTIQKFTITLCTFLVPHKKSNCQTISERKKTIYINLLYPYLKAHGRQFLIITENTVKSVFYFFLFHNLSLKDNTQSTAT